MKNQDFHLLFPEFYWNRASLHYSTGLNGIAEMYSSLFIIKIYGYRPYTRYFFTG